MEENTVSWIGIVIIFGLLIFGIGGLIIYEDNTDTPFEECLEQCYYSDDNGLKQECRLSCHEYFGQERGG